MYIVQVYEDDQAQSAFNLSCSDYFHNEPRTIEILTKPATGTLYEFTGGQYIAVSNRNWLMLSHYDLYLFIICIKKWNII